MLPKRLRRIVVTVFLLALSARPAEAKRDAAKEATYVAELKSQPKIAARFQEATRLLDADHYPEAQAAYRDVLAAFPHHAPTLWRLSHLARIDGRRDEAISLARRAVGERPGWAAQATLVAALLSGSPDSAAFDEAESLLNTNDPDPDAQKEVAALRAQVAVMRDDRAGLRTALARLREVDPNGMPAHYFAAIERLQADELGDADDELERAVAAGLPAAEAQRIRDLTGITRHRNLWLYARAGGIAFAAWLLALLGIYLVGTWLSRATLRAIDRFDGNNSDDLRERTSSLRRAYARTIGLAATYYFISIPVVILIVLLAAGGVIYGFLLIGHIPIKLVLIVGLVALGSVWSMLKSLFVRRAPDEDPGRPLREDEAPALWAVLRDVAARVGTRPVDAVYLTVGTDMAVIERGTMSERLRDRGRRLLVLGVGLLPGFTQRQFRSVLAHEYGHFSNRDTAGGNTAMVVQASLMKSMIGIARAGGATFYNPAWHFVRGFHLLFLRVTLGASRLQEMMADHFAAVAYGAEAFRHGLIHVIRRSVDWSKSVDALVAQAQQQNRPVASLYAPPEGGLPAEELARAFDERMQEKGGPYDSHPPPGQRVAWVARVTSQPEPVPGDEDPTWALFRDRAGLEAEMTALANQRLEAQGVFSSAPRL